MNDRILGYIVIAMVVLFLILPVGYLLWQASTPEVSRTIAFKNVAGLSFLSVQDPVSIQGVEVGTIRDITIKGTTAYIEIETSDTLRLYGDYRITVVAKGVMGERYLTIQPGTPGKPAVPATELLNGTVAMGPDEALSHIGELKTAVHTLLLLSERLKDGTGQKASLIAQIWDFTHAIDSMIGAVAVQMGEIDTLVHKTADSAVVMLEKALTVTDTLGRFLPSAASTLSELIDNLEPLVDNVDHLLQQTDSVLVKIDNPDLFIWKKEAAAVSENLTELRKLIGIIRSDSLELPVRLW